jgi:chromosome partitioning protein
MPLIVAFVSQKGGVGKSTLARGLATFALRSGLKTRIADLDAQQHTALVWETTRARHVIKPSVELMPFGSVKEAVASGSLS